MSTRFVSRSIIDIPSRSTLRKLSPRSLPQTRPLPEQAASILDHYTRRWVPLPIKNVAVTPIAGYFGQGFPGSDLPVQRVLRQDRKSLGSTAQFALRCILFGVASTSRDCTSVVGQYRASGRLSVRRGLPKRWQTSPLSNILNRQKEWLPAMRFSAGYRQDLVREKEGSTIESAGPVDFGQRLIDNFGLVTWQTIVYEKGSWILRMLSERLGRGEFPSGAASLTRGIQGQSAEQRTISARWRASFVPAGQPDKSLANFFDTWIYGTGIPTLSAHSNCAFGDGRCFRRARRFLGRNSDALPRVEYLLGARQWRLEYFRTCPRGSRAANYRTNVTFCIFRARDCNRS